MANNKVDDVLREEIMSSDLNDKLTELKLLSCLIENPSLFVEAQNIISNEFFISQANYAIYKSMLMVFEPSDKNKTLDLNFEYDTLFYVNKNDLTSSKFLLAIKGMGTIYNREFKDGEDYYNYIKNSSFSIKSFSEYLDKFKDNGLRRKLYASLRKSQKDLLSIDEDKKVEHIIEESTKEQVSILVKSHIEKNINQISGACDNFVERIALRINNNETLGISSGFDVLDNAINFLQRGNLYVINARPKTGKSTILLKVADNLAKKNIPVLYIDTEMDTETEVVPRLLSLHAKVNNYWIINGSFVRHPEEYRLVTEAKDSITNLPLFHVYKPGIRLNDLISIIKLWLLRNVGTYYDQITGGTRLKDCVVIFDYLKITDRSNNNLKDYQILGTMTTALKDLAGQYGFPCLTAVQNNRSSVKEMDGQIVNAELAVANSDEILQYANYLMFLDKLRTPKHVIDGIEKGTYHSYLPDMPDDRLAMLLNQAITNIDDEAKNSDIQKLIGNRVFSIVAGRQTAVHQNNEFFTLNFDFAHSDVIFAGELAYQHLGKLKKR